MRPQHTLDGETVSTGNTQGRRCSREPRSIGPETRSNAVEIRAGVAPGQHQTELSRVAREYEADR